MNLKIKVGLEVRIMVEVIKLIMKGLQSLKKKMK